MTFGDVINQMLEATEPDRCLPFPRFTRRGWNGKGQFIMLSDSAVGEAGEYAPFIEISPVSGPRVPWLASQTDMLADDWEVVDA